MLDGKRRNTNVRHGISLYETTWKLQCGASLGLPY
jgi:hypothetical protein